MARLKVYCVLEAQTYITAIMLISIIKMQLRDISSRSVPLDNGEEDVATAPHAVVDETGNAGMLVDVGLRDDGPEVDCSMPLV